MRCRQTWPAAIALLKTSSVGEANDPPHDQLRHFLISSKEYKLRTNGSLSGILEVQHGGPKACWCFPSRHGEICLLTSASTSRHASKYSIFIIVSQLRTDASVSLSHARTHVQTFPRHDARLLKVSWTCTCFLYSTGESWGAIFSCLIHGLSQVVC